MPIIGSLAGGSLKGYFAMPSGVEAYEFIGGHTVSGSSTNSITISIPNTYKHLEIRQMGRNSRNNTNGPNWINPNNDTSLSNYVTQYFYSYGTVGTNLGGGYSTSEGGLPMQSAGNTAASGIYGVNTGVILDYNDTNKWKSYIATGGMTNNNSGDEVSSVTAGMWKSTSPITSLVFKPFTAPFIEGTTINVYGIKG